MTQEAFETINEGLHERGGYTMTAEEYERRLEEHREMIRDLCYALEDSHRANEALAQFQARHGKQRRMELFERVNKLLEQARKEVER